jgi:molybdopterin-guanine dinucleotide biosynthesis protein A
MDKVHSGADARSDSYDVTGVILAGGRSSRMGRDKAHLKIDGASLFDRVLSTLRPFFSQVLIAGDRPDLSRPGVPSLPDRYPGSSLGGLYTALDASSTEWVFVAPCDLPYPDPAMVACLLALREGWDAVVPRTPEGLEPLFALYRKSCLKPMREMLERGEYRVYDFYGTVRVRYVDVAELPAGWERALRNVNTPEEFRKLNPSADLS